jgi:FkbM family methyltransferase
MVSTTSPFRDAVADAATVNRSIDGLRGLAARPTLLYGAGAYADEVADFLATLDVAPVGSIVDPQYVRPGLYSFESARREFGDYNCVIAHVRSFEESWKSAAVGLSGRTDGLVPLDCRFWRTHASHAAPEGLDWLYNQLTDDRSRQTLVAWVDTKRTFRVGRLPVLRSRPQYFPLDLPGFAPRADDVVVDAGAYTGDTLAEMLSLLPDQRVERYVAFEPDSRNAARIRDLAAERGWGFVDVVERGAWRTSGELRFDAKGDSRSLVSDAGLQTIAVDTIDSRQLAPTFIKMDIEGAEVPALEGASETIRRHAPRLAVAVYHSLDDLLRVPRLLRELRPDYQIDLRAHSDYSEELVLYARLPETGRGTS